MIPKIIHFIWLGGNVLPPLEKKCIATWEKYNPEFTIIKWDESNVNIDLPIYHKAYKEKKWAFCADIIRLKVLLEYGGIYLDTDMEIIKSLEPLLNQSCFLGKEDSKNISAGIIGCTKGHSYIKDCFNELIIALQKDYIPIPQILTYVYTKNNYNSVKIYDYQYFYPYNPFQNDIKQLLFQDIVEETYSIHHWSYSWKPSIYSRIINKLKKTFSKNKYRN
ncbi:glycosyltransferase family 32 protein [Escherichia coli]|uniref:glycosyltransferase family 32 protein n=1 Tax=Escherichia coli TaxID=562 RepID=UPI001F0D6217|nr:glycosyltransferase [Escherichia coli]MCH4702917.1 tcdA/TcdB catalytic glycosyltransferase [Escherichia coli]MCH4721023.1 tcdA/TcdB catalytic glycosyltransferase [Escherichia coli]MCH4739048.1 tcdA/TcdB catalytic glycosyltransferase [Escherichia coli]HCP7638018.1 tcdA/TcdB catalytic glycosyltransferase [Escherichia coli]